MSNEKPNFEVGDKVEILVPIYSNSSRLGHVCYGVVERLTKTLVIVRNEHGNISKFYRETARAFGSGQHLFTNSLVHRS